MTTATGEHHASVQRIQLRISGMSCSACAHRVESTLGKLPGFGRLNYGGWRPSTPARPVDAARAVGGPPRGLSGRSVRGLTVGRPVIRTPTTLDSC